MRIAKDGYPLIAGFLVVFGIPGAILLFLGIQFIGLILLIVALIGAGFMVFFFRDPDRIVTASESEFISGADGVIRSVEYVPEEKFLKTDAVRVSVFLSPFNVHLNRAPMAGQVTALQYTPGRHLLTIDNAASEVNEHSSILIKGKETQCLVRQIVGPIVRRVVYWLSLDQEIGAGERIGMMKFGSRLDIYFPASDVDVRVKKGERVQAGLSVIACLKKEPSS